MSSGERRVIAPQAGQPAVALLHGHRARSGGLHRPRRPHRWQGRQATPRRADGSRGPDTRTVTERTARRRPRPRHRRRRCSRSRRPDAALRGPGSPVQRRPVRRQELRRDPVTRRITRRYGHLGGEDHVEPGSGPRRSGRQTAQCPRHGADAGRHRKPIQRRHERQGHRPWRRTWRRTREQPWRGLRQRRSRERRSRQRHSPSHELSDLPPQRSPDRGAGDQPLVPEGHSRPRAFDHRTSLADRDQAPEPAGLAPLPPRSLSPSALPAGRSGKRSRVLRQPRTFNRA